MTDQIADMFTRIKNAISSQKRTVTIPASKIKKEIARLLFENQYIAKYAFVDDGKQGVIKILLKYDAKRNNAIQGLERISKPSCRKYYKANTIPKVMNGMGMAIVSTSKGILKDADCRKMNIGGEVIGKIW
jgi:small subunit ribosomal protein S8